MKRTGAITVVDSKQICNEHEPLFELYEFPSSVIVGGQTLQSREQLENLQTKSEVSSSANCVHIEDYDNLDTIRGNND